jgi:PAS domain S-box-containing protein
MAPHEWTPVPNLLEAVFHHLSDALVIYDADRNIRAVNRATERLFGMTAEEMVGQHCSDVFRCGECDPNCGVLVSIESAHPTHGGAVRIHTGNGRERLAVIKTTPYYDGGGQLAGSVATIRDVTEELDPKRREMVGESQAMRELMRFARRVAVSEATTILIEGENGTGKDLVAKTIHSQSMRQSEPFIAINCAAIPETLLESELFGYEKGAFTDAKQQKRGIFELADKGTLFLDEIGEIPLMLQVKLLRVLEDQTFRRLGGLRDIHLDLRVIAATNKNLREAVHEGAFRQDLYFRLNVIHIEIPPLRERVDDILPLARFFIDAYNRKFRRQVEGLTPEAARLLVQHHWPGNVREVRNAIERAMILEEGSLITADSLPISVASPAGAAELPVAVAAAAPSGFSMSLEEQEVALLRRALDKTAGNQTQAARLLKITRDTLRYKMKKFGLH